MKKFLLSAALLGGVLGAEAQVMFSTDFESPTYTLGDFTGALETGTIYSCQNGFKVIAGTAGLVPANHQIAAGTGTNTTNVLSMTGWAVGATAEGTKSNDFFIGYETQWSGMDTTPKTRLDGNDVAELKFDLWIPANTTSRDYLHVKLLGNASNRICLIALSPRVTSTSTTTLLRGVVFPGNAYTNMTGSAGNIIPRNTWVPVTMTYNTATGEVQTQINGGVIRSATTDAGIAPAYLEIDMQNDGATINTPASTLKIDNIVITATPTSTLGTKEIYRENNDVAVYVTNNKQLEVAAKVEVTALEIYDLSGRLLAENKNSNSIDVSALQNGTYVAKYSDKKQTYSKRFIK